VTPDLEALARRAVACRGWRWMPGILVRMDRIVARSSHVGAAGDVHIVWPDSDLDVRRAYLHADIGNTRRAVLFPEDNPRGRWWRLYYPGSAWVAPPGDVLPDLADPATLGCLLALVREAWGDDGITTYRDADVLWRCRYSVLGPVRGRYFGEADSVPYEAASLVAALEAAP